MANLIKAHGLVHIWAITDAVLFLVCGWLASRCYRTGLEIRLLKAETDFLKTQLMTPPIAMDAPPGVDISILQQVIYVSWSYSVSGVRGNRTGHLLVVGDATQLFAKGFIQGLNTWQYLPTSSIMVEEHKETLRMEMNMPGAHIIDGNTGRITASKFFATVSPEGQNTKGSGTKAAKILSRVPGVVVIKVSADGSIKEFRNGKLLKQHCCSRIRPCSSVHMGWSLVL